MQPAVLVPDAAFLHDNRAFLQQLCRLLAGSADAATSVKFVIPLVALEELNAQQVRSRRVVDQIDHSDR